MYPNVQCNPWNGFPKFAHQQAGFQGMGSNAMNQQWMGRNDVNHNSFSHNLMMQQQATPYQSLNYGTTGRYLPGYDYYSSSNQHKQSEPYNTTTNANLERYAPSNLERTVTKVDSRSQNLGIGPSDYNNAGKADSRILQTQFTKVDPRNLQNQRKGVSDDNYYRSNSQVQPVVRAVLKVKPLRQMEHCENTVNNNNKDTYIYNNHSFTENNWLIPPYGSGKATVDAIGKEGDKHTHNFTEPPLIHPTADQRYYNTKTINMTSNNSTVALQSTSPSEYNQAYSIQRNSFEKMNLIFNKNHNQLQQYFDGTAVTHKRKSDSIETGYRAKHIRVNGENGKYKCIDQASQTDGTKTSEHNNSLDIEAKFMSNAMALINQLRSEVNVMSEKINYFQRSLQSCFDDIITFRKTSYEAKEDHTKQTNETHTKSTAHTEQANQETTQYFNENSEPGRPIILNIEVNTEQHTTRDSYGIYQKENRANNEVPNFVQVKSESSSSFSDEIFQIGQRNQINNDVTEITIKKEVTFNDENSLKEENGEYANHDTGLQIKEENTDGIIEDTICERFHEPLLNNSLVVKQETLSQNELQQSMGEFSQEIDSFLNQEVPIEELRKFIENNVRIGSYSDTSNVANTSTITQRTRASNTDGNTSNKASMDELRRSMEDDVRTTATISNREQSNIESKLPIGQPQTEKNTLRMGQPRSYVELMRSMKIYTQQTNDESDRGCNTANESKESTQAVDFCIYHKVLQVQYKSTLKHPEFKEGLSELTEGSGVFVNQDHLNFCFRISRGQGSLAASLQFIIFSEECLRNRKLIKDVMFKFGNKIIIDYVRKIHELGCFSEPKCMGKMRAVLRMFHFRIVRPTLQYKPDVDGKNKKRNMNLLKLLFKKLKLKTNTF